jgi:hypothetical protein
MRLTWGEGVEVSEHRFDGVHACESQAKATLWIDLIGPALWDKGSVSAKAKWLVLGQVIDPHNAASVLASLPAPEWLETEAPVLVNEPPEGLGLMQPCYAIALKPRKAGMLELTVTVGLAKEVEQASARARALPEGGLAESAQEILERCLRELDIEGIRMLLLPPSAAAPAADDTQADEGAGAGGDTDGDAAVGAGVGVGEDAIGEVGHAESFKLPQLEWTHSKTGEGLVSSVLLREDGDPELRAQIFSLLLDTGAPAPPVSEEARSQPGGAPSPLHMVVSRGDVRLAARMLQRPDAFPAHALCLWRGRHCITPLHVACERGDLPMSELLLAHGARADWSGVSGRVGSVTPLALAIESGNVELARVLLVEKQAAPGLRTLDPRYGGDGCVGCQGAGGGRRTRGCVHSTRGMGGDGCVGMAGATYGVGLRPGWAGGGKARLRGMRADGRAGLPS